ncbi:MAG: hypothetical protein KGZ30_01670 [Anaplasmataceae bacterium]|nr:hypothetical protein [Anaplasmataceae bacterium]
MISGEFVALVCEMLGSLMIGYAALSVHHRVLNEHSIDDRVFRVMRVEQKVGILGMFLIVLSFIIQVILV